MAKVQQIIQHRKGCIDKIKDINSYLSEIIYGTGTIGDITGNVVFIGNQNSGSGNYSPISKIYFGTNAPTVNAYKNTLNGLPFYSVYDKTLYILNNPKNIDMDLSGNIYRRNIAPNNISASGFISGNSLNITGDVKLGKNDSNIIEINGKIKGSLIPLTSNTYDLGTPTNKWRNIYATLISGSFEGDGSNLKNLNTSMSVEILGQTTSTYNISIPNEKLSIYTNPTNGINLTMGSKRIEIIPFNATYSQRGVSYYNNSDFIVNLGYVSIDQTKFNQLSSSFKDFTSSINTWTGSTNTILNNFSVYTSSFNTTFTNFSSSVNTQFINVNTSLNNFSSYTSSFNITFNNYTSSVSSSLDSLNLYTSSLNVATGSFFKQGGNSFGETATLGTTDSFVLNLITDNTPRLSISPLGNILISKTLEINQNLLIRGGTFIFSTLYDKDLSTGTVNQYLKSNSTNGVQWTTPQMEHINGLLNYTSSVSSSLNSLNLYTASNNVIINNFSVYISSFNTTFTNFSSSVNTQFINVNTSLNNFSSYTSSFNITFNNYTSSVSSSLDSLNLYTSSLNVATGSFFKQGGNSFGANAILGTNDNFSLSFETNGVTKAVLGTDGKLTIGTVSSPTALLNVGGDIIAMGDVSAYSASDIRLKENVLKIKNPSTILSKINGYTYEWNDRQSLYKKGTRDIGLIAQEVEKVLPEIVAKRYDGYKSIKYERLIAVLIEAFNEMKHELDYLKGRL